MPPSRRDILRCGAAALAAARTGTAVEEGVEVNDVHSQLNHTKVARVVRPESLEQLRTAILRTRDEGKALSISGSRHSMGGQQFGTGMTLVDTRSLTRVLDFDPESRTIETEAGIEWPELLKDLSQRQNGDAAGLGIVQKQTGADRLSLGGALASNVHGRGLNLRPIIQDVESFELMNADGDVLRCNRPEILNYFAWQSAVTGFSALLPRCVCA
jgi:FAD/FMN-containing dehydrogenase